MKLISVLLGLSLIFAISFSAEAKEDPWIWLSKIAGNDPPEINLTGKWRDTAGTGMLTWGEGFLTQDQNKVTGVIGDYKVVGIVSGKKVYLVFLYGDRIYYTASLELSQQFVQDELAGSYFKAKDREQKYPSPTSFTKLKER
ncbi:MAG TPA: hypothetical protein VLZ10_14800 [Thermodesulfobacteriota bacterium]|nr:hypothetical protein [Thermodesulfobacteriota bacterium]